MKNLLIAALLCLLTLPAWAQKELSGRVRDAQTGEVLAGAVVRIEGSRLAQTTDLEGRFRFAETPADAFTLSVSYLGYETHSLKTQAGELLEILLSPQPLLTEEVIVSATRATEKTPTTYSEISEEELDKMNMGQDIPYLLNLTPSLVSTSDAGAGVGYTGLRIRGSDASRINVTVNGIPLNDAESHGVFWVNMPDFASSVESMQIQRGVGTSTNGAAAFGASVNIQTNTLEPQAYAELDNSYGSFNTWKHSVKAGSGLLNDRFAFDARLSKISSEGYVDRASADLKSFYISGGYYGEHTLVKANVFSGKEKTYQAWWGVPEALLESNPTYNYYTYENETDNYQQDHYQLIAAHDFLPNFSGQLALHYTKGRGYYEQFREDDEFASYPVLGADSLMVGQDTVKSMDLIRQRWLDNDFYGFTFAFDYRPGTAQLVLGGGWNRYKGAHFGEIIWAEYALASQLGDRYYDNDAEKSDGNIYLKAYLPLNDRLQAYADLQFRYIGYEYAGIDSDQRRLLGDHSYYFLNPKLGASYQLKPDARLYASFAFGQREPVRNDFIDAPAGRIPAHEKLRNLELGYDTRLSNTVHLVANYYLMDYKNQLVLTGELNDVGSPIRANVPKSYRTGLELQLGWQPVKEILLQANTTLSRNKIEEYEEILYFYDDVVSEQRIRHQDTDISFSPSVISGGSLSYFPVAGLELALLSKYVGKQYLDNTQSESRRLDAYWVNDFRLNYRRTLPFLKEVRLGLLVNNLFNTAYASNGYTYGYGYGSTVVYENFYYPQAGTNFLLSLGLSF